MKKRSFKKKKLRKEQDQEQRYQKKYLNMRCK